MPPPVTATNMTRALPPRRVSTGRKPLTGMDILIVLTVASTMVLNPRIFSSLTVPDVFLLLVNLCALRHHLTRDNLGRRVLAKLLPWLWILLLATIPTFFFIGLPGWALETLFEVLIAPITFTSLLALFDGKLVTVRRARTALIAVAAFSSSMLLLGVGSGRLRHYFLTFPNPNYYAHFLATALVLLLMYRTPNKLMKTGLAALLIVGQLLTGSFGGVIQLLGFGTYGAWFLLSRIPARFRIIIIMLMGGIAFALASVVSPTALDPSKTEFDAGSGLSTTRLERSQEGRLDLWSRALDAYRANPQGIGPGGFDKRTDLGGGYRNREVHSDPLAFLVEHGPVGLLAALGIAFTLWRMAPARGGARALLFSLGFACIFRQTFTYRHVWVALAIALALDLQNRAIGYRTVRGPAEDEPLPDVELEPAAGVRPGPRAARRPRTAG